MRANDKRINGRWRKKIKRSVFYGTNLQFFDSLEKRTQKYIVDATIHLCLVGALKDYAILSTEVYDAALYDLFRIV